MEESDDNAENKVQRPHVNQNGRHHEPSQQGVENKLFKPKKLTNSNAVNVYEQKDTNGCHNKTELYMYATCKKTFDGNTDAIDNKFSCNDTKHFEKMTCNLSEETSQTFCLKFNDKDKNEPAKNKLELLMPLNSIKTDLCINQNKNSAYWNDNSLKNENMLKNENKTKNENGIERKLITNGTGHTNGSVKNGDSNGSHESKHKDIIVDSILNNGNGYTNGHTNGYTNAHTNGHINGHSNGFTFHYFELNNGIEVDNSLRKDQNGNVSIDMNQSNGNINDSGYCDDSFDLSNDNIHVPDCGNSKSENISTVSNGHDISITNSNNSVDLIDFDIDSDYKLDDSIILNGKTTFMKRVDSATDMNGSSLPVPDIKNNGNMIAENIIDNDHINTAEVIDNNSYVSTMLNGKTSFSKNSSTAVNGSSVHTKEINDFNVVPKNSGNNDTVEIIDKNGNVDLVPYTCNEDDTSSQLKNETNGLKEEYLPSITLDDDVFIQNGDEAEKTQVVETTDIVVDENKKSIEYLKNNDDNDIVSNDSSCSKILSPTKSELTLFEACRQGHYDVVKSLLTSNVDFDINMTDGDSWTCLHETSIRTCQFTGITELLLQNGANPNLRDKKGETPLHGAVLFHLVDTIKLLLKYNADYDISNNTHVSPLKLATLLKDNEILLLFDQSVCEQKVEKKKRKKRKRNSHKDFVLPLNTSPSILKKRRITDESSSSTTTPRSKKRINFSL